MVKRYDACYSMEMEAPTLSVPASLFGGYTADNAPLGSRRGGVATLEQAPTSGSAAQPGVARASLDQAQNARRARANAPATPWSLGPSSDSGKPGSTNDGWNLISRSLPCADWNRFGRFQVNGLPDQSKVAAFMSAISSPYSHSPDARLRPSTSIADAFRSFDATRDEVPRYGDWAEPLSEKQTLYLNAVVGLLTSNVIGPWARMLRQNQGAVIPPGWSPRQFNSILDRLLNRLGVNHETVLGQLVQVDWAQSPASAEVLAVHETVFAIPSASNPWVKFRLNLSQGTGSASYLNDIIDHLGVVLEAIKEIAARRDQALDIEGLLDALSGIFTTRVPAPDDVFPFPMQWDIALTWGLLSPTDAAAAGIGNNEVRIPAGSLNALTSTLESHMEAIRWISSNSGWLKWSLFSLLMSQGQTLLALRAYGFVDYLDHVSDLLVAVDGHLQDADSGDLANRTVNSLLYAVLTLAYVGDDPDAAVEEMLGVSMAEALGIARALDDRADWSQSFLAVFGIDPDQDSRWPLPMPIIYLDTCFKQYAKSFNDYWEVHQAAPVVAAHQQRAANAWAQWAQETSPVLQVAEAFDMAGRIMHAMLTMDDVSTASLPKLMRASGAVGVAITGALTNVVTTLLGFPVTPQMLRASSDALDFAWILGYVVRQALTDVFVEYMIQYYGASRDCLNGIFCWMDSTAKQNNVRAALGDLEAISTPHELANEFTRSGLVVPDSIYVRACLTTNIVGNTQVFVGALGLVFQGLTTSPIPLGGAVGQIVFNILPLQAWMSNARQSCVCGFRNNWEPEWSYGPTPGPVSDLEEPLGPVSLSRQEVL